MSSKQKSKTKLQEKLGFEENPKTPLLLIYILENKEEQKLVPLLEGLTVLELQTIIAPLPTHRDVISFRDKYPNKIKTSELDLEKLLEASDMVYFHGHTLSQEKIEKSLKRKVVPIVKTAAYSIISNFDPIKEKGNSFTFDEETPWHIFTAVVRATETYKFSYDWKNIVDEGRQVSSNKQPK